MTISNMVNEPRRELTESFVGVPVALVFLLGFAYYDWWLTNALSSPDETAGNWWLGALVGVPILTVIALAVIWVFVIATHKLGDEICNFLDERGLRLRPVWRHTDRYQTASRLYTKDWQNEKTGEWWSDVTKRAPRVDAGGEADGPVPAGRSALVPSRNRPTSWDYAG